MGRTDEKREGMFQSFRLPSLCCYAPLWSLSYGQAFIRSTISTVQTRQCIQGYTLWQLMRGKIQLTICKHKKAVGNEKKSKNKQNRQSIHESMTFDWHCYCGFYSINMSKHTLQVLHRLLANQPVSTNRNGVNYMWTSNESGLWRLRNWPTTQIYTEEPVPSGNKV